MKFQRHFDKMSIRKKIKLLNISNIIIFVILGISSLASILLLAHFIEIIFTKWLPLNQSVIHVSNHQITQEMLFEKVIVANLTDNQNDLEKYIIHYNSVGQKKIDELEKINKLLTSIKEENRYKHLREDFEDIEVKITAFKKEEEDLSRRISEYLQTSSSISKEEFLQRSTTFADNFGKTKKAILAVIQTLEDKIDEGLYFIEAESGDPVKWIIFTIVAGFVINILFAFLIVRSITGPLKRVVERLKDIADGDGDLTKRIEVVTSQELEEMIQWINRFIDTVEEIVKGISNSTKELGESSKELDEASQFLSSGAEETNAQSHSISTASQQMSQNMMIVANAVEEMAASIQEVANQATTASSVAHNAQNTAENTGEIINGLKENAKEIGIVTETISSIADKAILLSLNASIEAAGAGDAGKGFAVVAGEVKELAKQSADSAEDIKKRISDIQNSTEHTVNAIGKITEIISKLNDINATIAAAMEEQSITTKEIATNVNQSSSASSEIAENIGGITVASGETSKSAIHSLELARSMKEMTIKLETLVQRFKL
jgi:methyl-accepting chemotaxis protein